jgi:hypothetical protein
MDPADGLMRIEPGDWGSSESSRAVWKDTQLQGMWVRALRDLERLARLVSITDGWANGADAMIIRGVTTPGTAPVDWRMTS